MVAIHDDGPFHRSEKARNLGEEMHGVEANPSMRRIDVIGLNRSLCRSKWSECKAANEQKDAKVFHAGRPIFDPRWLSQVMGASRKRRVGAGRSSSPLCANYG